MNPLRWLARLLFGDDDAPPGPEEMVLLARPDGEMIAGLWREMLEGKGVHTLVKNVDALSAQINAPGPSWAYEIHVLYRDLERAREILGIEEAP